MESSESKDYNIYRTLRNQIRNTTRKARMLKKSIASEAKTNLKKFWNFANSQTETKEGINNLTMDDNKETTTDEEKVEGLLNQFSVFTLWNQMDKYQGHKRHT